MMVLQNEQIKIKVQPIGAELQELTHLPTGINYLWTGDPAYWGKFSPVLFPIVGSLKENTYRYNGKAYSLSRHGFAREKTFECIDQSEQSISFLLTDDASTRAVYPFAFNLVIRYALDGNRLSCSYLVSNTDSKPILFSLGAHPAFAVPLPVPGVSTTYTDYYLEFDHSAELNRYSLHNGLIKTETQTVPLNNKQLHLDPALFTADAIVLKHIPDSSIRLACRKHSHGLDFSFRDFPYFGIWAASNAPFVCLEPWCGIADSVDHQQNLEEKEGIIQLEPGQLFERSWVVSLF